MRPNARSVFLAVLLGGLVIFMPGAQAATVNELKAQIDDRQNEIDKLNQSIAAQEKALNEISKQAGTLQNALKISDLTLKKLSNESKRTTTQIRATELKLQELNSNIQSTSNSVENHEAVLRDLLRRLAENGRESLLMMLARYRQLSDFLIDENQTVSLQRRIYQSATELRGLRVDLDKQASETEAAKIKLFKLKQELADQQKIAAAERTRQNALLTQTKNQEQNYKKLLDETRERRESFARELQQFESQLRLEIDPNRLPDPRKGVLAWPLQDIFITQQFGRTSDAKRLYASGTHNGIDLRASIGTPVKAAAIGTVTGVGDTDLVCRGASYGRWVLIKHDNGLATLYGHLSLIKVAENERVTAGQLIGYTGRTGYATGPHLHLTVAAAQGVEIKSFKSAVCPGTYVMPIFDARAYLDPVLYL